ncbi:MAG: hypothetical protein GY859_35415, partial [Desulfobacterales bacterium]|nr:hypothetical protein [Desulfobacterales bacterium]
MKQPSHGIVIIIILLLLTLLPGMEGAARAENPGMEKLLEIFEKKGAITSAEAEIIRRAMAEDQERLSARTREMDERERDLERREKALREKENALKAGAVAVGGEMAVDDAAEPGEATMDAPDDFAGALLEGIHRDGFCFQTKGKDPSSLCIGGMLQADYRHFNYRDEDPAKNKFDLRRARLFLKGKIPGDFDYKFEYEFQGAGTRRLLDAYVDAHLFPFVSVRIGQFKEPFGLEQYSSDKNLFFAERSMGCYITPGRDVGLMAHGSLLNDRIHYGVGLFNGDGPDDATGGDVDSPQWAGRLVATPFRGAGIEYLENLQVGGSMEYASIDRNNVGIHVKTAGLTPFFDVSSSTKFNIIREADSRAGYGAELGWSL